MRHPHRKFQKSLLTGSLGGVCTLGILFCTLSAGAMEPAVPWECSGFTDEARDRCIRTFVELQQEKIDKLEKELEIQQQTVQQLQQQAAQQASATAELERQLTQTRSRWYDSPWVGVYPSFGLGLRFGGDRFYGGSLFYGQPYYFGPRFYGYGYRRWHRY